SRGKRSVEHDLAEHTSNGIGSECSLPFDTPKPFSLGSCLRVWGEKAKPPVAQQQRAGGFAVCERALCRFCCRHGRAAASRGRFRFDTFRKTLLLSKTEYVVV